MSSAMIVLGVLAVLVLVVLLLVLQVLRRLQQLRRGGVDVAVRPSDGDMGDGGDGRRWHSGIARYRGDQFRWYRVSGLRTAPNVVLDRTELEIVDRRPARSVELHTPTATVLCCRTRAGTWELAMAPDVLTGFSSWLESTPPGRSTGYRQAS